MAEIAAMDCRRCGRAIEPDADVVARIGSKTVARRYDDCDDARPLPDWLSDHLAERGISAAAARPGGGSER